ncbi:MAG: ATP-binding cassette domain-containing protein [Clostridia bacterium]|nr:ATP-binding cassette domain-containing protein [Clostridia bacterium]
MENNKKLLLSVKDLHVKFRVRGRILTAIRGISLDIYENESIAIVGESGSGKSVFTKTFAGMLDENGYISRGDIIFNDDELAETYVDYTESKKKLVASLALRLNKFSKLELGARTYCKMKELESEENGKMSISAQREQEFNDIIADLTFKMTELFNRRQTMDRKNEKAEIADTTAKINAYKAEIKRLEEELAKEKAENKAIYKNDTAAIANYNAEMAALRAQYNSEITGNISDETVARNLRIAKEVYLSVGRFGYAKGKKLTRELMNALKTAMTIGVDLSDENELNRVFDTIIFRVRYIDESEDKLHGRCVLNLAKIKDTKDWTQIRGNRIATVFQDPMTSLNPIITIGKQISSIIMKHQHCTELEARERAISMMKKVGIPNAEKRFDDYPFQYSGGMRQRIVIAIALSCQPKILICDEPTTALDVTIQAQILDLLKKLQREFNYTIVFITHDLGVVANIADRVAVLYAGQVVELGNVNEVFYDPRHPYTWALLSSLPQLAERQSKLFSISGTPPSLYNTIVGDPFAPRNQYCMKIDTLKEPPMFRVTDTHYAKTWLLDPRSPKVEKPEAIHNIHEKLSNAFNI